MLPALSRNSLAKPKYPLSRHSTASANPSREQCEHVFTSLPQKCSDVDTLPWLPVGNTTEFPFGHSFAMIETAGFTNSIKPGGEKSHPSLISGCKTASFFNNAFRRHSSPEKAIPSFCRICRTTLHPDSGDDNVVSDGA
jgi:hypothetical protein